MTELARGSVPRPVFATERVLIAAADGGLVVPTRRAWRRKHRPEPAYVDGRPMTDSEVRALVALVRAELVRWRGDVIRPTAEGFSLVERWARYVPLGGDRR